MPADIARGVPFGTCRLPVREFDASPTEQCFTILVNIQVFSSTAAPVANEVPYKASAEVGGGILDTLGIFV